MLFIHLSFIFSHLIHLRFLYISFLKFFFPFSLAAPAEDDSYPQRAGDDEGASPKWLQSVVISGCCCFLRGAHQNFIIMCHIG